MKNASQMQEEPSQHENSDKKFKENVEEIEEKQE